MEWEGVRKRGANEIRWKEDETKGYGDLGFGVKVNVQVNMKLN